MSILYITKIFLLLFFIHCNYAICPNLAWYSQKKTLSPGPDNLEYIELPNGWNISLFWNGNDIEWLDSYTVRSLNPNNGLLFFHNHHVNPICTYLKQNRPGLWHNQNFQDA